MAYLPANPSPIHEIEQRQDQVLAELEALEQQLSQLLAQFAPPPKSDSAATQGVVEAPQPQRLDRAA
ncbi:MAG: hypothetical protein JNM18_08450 [Planctomycetaceae bacterium]|nr:hypothetical protein [Planctomycetaceae bacterium]